MVWISIISLTSLSIVQQLTLNNLAIYSKKLSRLCSSTYNAPHEKGFVFRIVNRLVIIEVPIFSCAGDKSKHLRNFCRLSRVAISLSILL